MTEAKWENGVVCWFNDSTGDGVIRSQSGVRYYVHYSSIKPPMALKSGQTVKFKELKANYVKQASEVRLGRV